MNDALSRRGFTRIAVLGAAALWLPRQGHAQALPRISSRLAASTSEGRLTLELFVRNEESGGLELLAHAVHLEARGHDRPTLELRSDRTRFMRRSRAGFRVGRRVVLPPNGESLYDTYGAPWPDDRRSATLTIRSVLDVPASSRPSHERGGLRALAAIAGQVTVPA